MKNNSKGSNNHINLLFTILFFILLQFLILDYVFFQIIYSSYSIYILAFLFLLSLGFYYYKINGFYLFSLLPLFIAIFISANYPENFSVFVIYFLFAVYIFYIYKKNYVFMNNDYEPDIYIFLFFFVLSAFIIFLVFLSKETITVLDRKTLKWYICLRGSGEHMNLVFHSKFNDVSRLILPIFFLLAIFIFNFLVGKQIIKKDIFLIIILILFTFIGKFVIADLSDKGIDVIKEKIESKYNCSYYYFAEKYKDNFYNFIKDYTSIHQKERDNAHIKGHPILPVLLYWLIIKFTSPSSFIAGIIIAFLSSLTVIPLFYILKIFFKDNIISYFGCFFYSMSANSLILSIAGIDSIIVLIFSVTLFYYLFALDKNKWYLFLLSGIFFGINSYLTFGLWHLLPFLFIYYFIYEKNINKIIDKNEIFNFIQMCIYFVAGIFLFHFLIWVLFLGKFNYFESFNIAKLVHIDIISFRPYKLWVWLNFIHWSLYISVGLISLYFYRYIMALTGKIKMDPFSLLSFIFLIVNFLSCTARAETHRIWMFLIVLIVPVSIMVVINKQNKINFLYANIFTGLIFINSVLIEIFITDAH